MAPQRPLRSACRKKDLELGARENDRAHVAPVGNQPWRARKPPLPLEKGLADLGPGSDSRGPRAHLLGPEPLAHVPAAKQDALALRIEPHIECERDLHVRIDITRLEAPLRA